MENRVQQLRKDLGLSQSKLAKLAGTSQQQIQRIETGGVAAKLNLAAKISAALKKPLDVVFPGAAKAIQAAEHEMAISKYLPTDAWKKMREIGIEGDPRSWIAKVLLRGHDEPLYFDIPGKEKDYLYRTMQDEKLPDAWMSFVVFDTESRRYALNLEEVMLCQFLFEVDTPGMIEEDESSPENEDCRVDIYFRGRQRPFSLDVDLDEPEDEVSLGQCGDILSMLEMDVQETNRYWITDIDGEVASVRAGDLALLSVPLAVIDPPEYEEELD